MRPSLAPPFPGPALRAPPSGLALSSRLGLHLSPWESVGRWPRPAGPDGLLLAQVKTQQRRVTAAAHPSPAGRSVATAVLLAVCPLITAGEVAASDVWGQPCGTEPLVCGVCADAGELVSKSNCGTPSWCRRIRELVGVETATFAVGQAETL